MDDEVASTLRRSVNQPEAYTRFYEEHVEALYAFIARRVYDHEMALDLAAETFAQAYLSRKRFRGTTDAEAAGWLYGIAKRQVAQYFRRSRVERRALDRLGIEVPDLDGDQRERLDELASLSEHRAFVRIELARLSPGQQHALRLRVVDELPYRDVASRLNITEGAARVRVTRGLKALAEALEASQLLQRGDHDEPEAV